MNIFRSVYGFFYVRHADHKRERSRNAAMTTPKDCLFNPSGWGPEVAKKQIAKPYVGPLYPAPEYHKYSPKKNFHKVKPAAIKLCNEARAAWSEKNLKAAERAYRQASEVCPRVPDFLFEEAHLLWSQGRLDEAQTRLDEALERDPAFGSAHASRLLVQTERHNFPEICADYARFAACTNDIGQEGVIGGRVRAYRSQ